MNNQNDIPKCWFRKDAPPRHRWESSFFLEKKLGTEQSYPNGKARPAVRGRLPSWCSRTRNNGASIAVRSQGWMWQRCWNVYQKGQEPSPETRENTASFPGNSSTFWAEGKGQGPRPTAPHSPMLPLSLPRMTFKGSTPPHLASS